ncbi:hypothetical protein BaRGS_00000110 [Batillaria attramentaria]|uniref:Uncharacterized protein n=1 Tax=Batillaria attramentaria TaxID=370345 RepID=A0ABD0M9Q2_9CAEN
MAVFSTATELSSLPDSEKFVRDAFCLSLALQYACTPKPCGLVSSVYISDSKRNIDSHKFCYSTDFLCSKTTEGELLRGFEPAAVTTCSMAIAKM